MLSELSVILTAGFFLPIIGFFILYGSFIDELFIFTIPFVIYGFNFALCVELPDYEADIMSSKRNLISTFGRDTGYFLIIIFSLIGSIVFFIIQLLKLISVPVNFLIIGLASLTLIAISLYGFINNRLRNRKDKYNEKRKAATFSKYYLFGIISLLIFLNIYFIVIITGK
jgi:1,4-dihydroxy-2-naphthoate octaprenyltransferase